ncbi:MAG: exopolygalacturonase [Bacteroidaceae bacterium]|nr:exopolygalacturonase [Bacteroidaceae bacterium]
MKRILYSLVLVSLCVNVSARRQRAQQDLWPDGTPVSAWFADTSHVDVNTLGRRYVITDYGVVQDSTVLQTAAIQRVIDRSAEEGGGVVVIPRGTFLSGSLFFRQGTHLHLEEGARLKGIDAIKYYPLVDTRMEGQSLKYFAALVNADGLDGFTITGAGTIDGNGLRFWEEFWIRRRFNPECTNLEALRPRLVYMSNCKNVQVQDVHLINSAFWTNHLYRCERVKYIGCTIFAPHEPAHAKAPSSDALDLDVCRDVLVHGCTISVNDDAVVIKGGKGTWADRQPDNGPTSNVIIQHCHYGFVHGCLTLGSESIHDWNVILRNCQVDNASRVLWLKMRPDTPQHYERIRVERLTGTCGSFLVVRPWTQFFKPEQRDDMPLSEAHDITMSNIKMRCRNFFDVGLSEKYRLHDFTFEDVEVEDRTGAFDPTAIEGTTVRRVTINGKRIDP